MSQNEPIIDVSWTGPFAWPDYEDVASLQPIPRHPGVYLQTFEYEDGFLIYAAGITRRDIPTRFREHTNDHPTMQTLTVSAANAPFAYPNILIT